jgi:hypothetical protein
MGFDLLVPQRPVFHASAADDPWMQEPPSYSREQLTIPGFKSNLRSPRES